MRVLAKVTRESSPRRYEGMMALALVRSMILTCVLAMYKILQYPPT